MKTKTNHLLVKQPLQIEALLAAVRRQTGLDHFGDETFREPLSRLLESCENEAHLNTMGRCALTQDILQLLINRLHIQRDREEWQWIAAEAITAPLFTMGLPRTGDRTSSKSGGDSAVSWTLVNSQI